MKDKTSNWIGKWLCQFGIHKFRVIEVKFGFGTSGQVETVECERCGKIGTRRAR